MRDTLPEAEILRLAAVRRLDPRERLRQALDLSDLLRQLALTGAMNAQRIEAQSGGHVVRGSETSDIL